MAGLKIARSWLMAGLVKCPVPGPLVERASFGWMPSFRACTLGLGNGFPGSSCSSACSRGRSPPPPPILSGRGFGGDYTVVAPAWGSGDVLAPGVGVRGLAPGVGVGAEPLLILTYCARSQQPLSLPLFASPSFGSLLITERSV